MNSVDVTGERRTTSRHEPPAPYDVGTDPVAAALALADAFAAGGRLLVTAPEAADHAHHVAVEFVHPVIAGLPALAAVALAPGAVPARADQDVVLAIGRSELRGADLTIAGDLPDADVMALYHLLWELVHVVLDHQSRDASAGDSTGFLYPFLGDGAAPADDGLGAALRDAAAAQRDDSARARTAALRTNEHAIAATAEALARAAVDRRRVHVLGNGGSATDASRLVRLLSSIGVPAGSLADDYAVVTALANDLGAEHIFARQVDAFVGPGDVLLGWSTSGTSRNVVAAFERASALGATCVGSCGYGGDALAALDSVEITLTVDEQSVHRIQEAQADLMATLVEAIAAKLAARGGAT